MSHPTSVHNHHWQEFPEDLDDTYTELSLSSEEPDTLISLPRSPSRLDFFYEEGNLNRSESEADADVPISRVKLARSLFLSGTASERIPGDEDVLLFRPPILHTNDHCANSQTRFEGEPASVPPSTVTMEPLAPEPVRHYTLPQEHNVTIPTQTSRIRMRRLNYPHHGFSRSAFLHHKSFWTARHDEWLEWQANEVRRRASHRIRPTDPVDAYTGILVTDHQVASGPPSQFRVPPSGLERDFEGNVPRCFGEDLNAPIYPRVGDISALRDPYSENVDRCFFKFPLWTIQKTLYIFDMHQMASPTSGIVQSSTSLGSLQSSTGSTSGYEDITLVIDDEALVKKTTLEKGLHQSLPPRTLNCSPPRAWKTTRDWNLSWYARWELLISLVQRDKDLQQTTPPSPSITLSESMDDDASPSGKLTKPRTPKCSIFHLADEYGEGEGEDDDNTMIMNPKYDKTCEEEYHRALDFFSRNRSLKRGPRYSV